MQQIINLDVTVLDPREKHPTIFARYDSLDGGNAVVIHNDHDPKPLYYQLLGERGNTFSWEYLEQGPEWWRVKITKQPANEQSPTLGELAAKDYRKAQVFKKYGLDFCCGGKKTLKEACDAKKIPVEQVERELQSVNNISVNSNLNYDGWSLDFLADFIINNHHQYVRRSLQPVKELAEKVARVHGAHFPFLIRVAQIFNEVAVEMESHMIKEEKIVFPYIKTLVQFKTTQDHTALASFGSVQQPVSMMEEEHEVVGEYLEQIRSLTNDFTLPAGACASFTLLYKWLNEFEEDLHLHVHLENNILFPKAIELEKELKSS
jgi:regulator of cell morphogenesis and NO signaling